MVPNSYTIHPDNSPIIISLEKRGAASYNLQAQSYQDKKKALYSTYKLPYRVWHFEIGDIDNNGDPDIAVGVIKPTYYDSVLRKRPFFFKLHKGHICPLWLGSSLSHPLEDFRIIKTDSGSLLQSMEYEKDGSFLVAQYSWNGFGFRFHRYLARGISKHNAYKLFGK
jgi:hypothetical protein